MGLWDAITDAVDAVGDAVGDVVGTTARAVDTATFGLAGRALHAADDYVFDTVDYVTGGLVDVDFDEGRFSVGAGFDGLAHVGASVGEDGVTADGGVLAAANFDLRLTRDGFLASGSAGIDWGPLPYAEGHVELLPNGDVIVNGHVQGTLPTPVGLFSGATSGGFARTTDAWGAYLDSEGTLRMPNGVTLRGAEHVAYQATADGSHLSLGLEGSASYQGLVTVGGELGYERLEHDGDVVQAFHAEGRVDALGASASAEADYVHAEIDGVVTSDWSGDADLDAPGLADAARAVGAATSPPATDDLAGPADDFGSAIEAADHVEQSLDHLLDDLP